MTTFSQLVDDMAAETLRPDFLRNGVIASYTNQTIREVHTMNDGQRVCRFSSNREEFRLNTGDTDTGFSWAIERVNCYQATESVYYPAVQRPARELNPGSFDVNVGRDDVSERFSYYRSGPTMWFRGYGGAGQEIWISAFYYPRSLVYHAVGERWATWDPETESFTYKPSTGKTTEELEDLSTNWILLRWGELVKEGVRAKVYKRLADSARAQLCYSAYMNARSEMQMQEIHQYNTVYER